MTAEFDVFLSHSSVDKPWVIKLKDDLLHYEVSVWLDKDEIRPGDLFAQALELALDNCRAVALIVSPEAINSGWVKEEYYRALSLAKVKPKRTAVQIIPVLLREAELPGFLENRSWVDFRDESVYAQKVWELVWGITGKKPTRVLDVSAPDMFPKIFPTPPEVLAEIEDLEQKKFPKLQSELRKDREKAAQAAAAKSPTNQIEILLEHPLSDVADGQQFIITLADKILDLPRRQFELLEVQYNTVRIEMPTGAVRELFRLHSKKDPQLKKIGVQGVQLLLSFQNRNGTRRKLLGSNARHIELYGPGGVGKTYMLKHIARRHNNVFSVYLKLTDYTHPEQILAEAVRQLTGQQPSSSIDYYSDLATAVNQLYQPEQFPTYNHFVFLFDAVKDEEPYHKLIEWLIGPDGLINHADFLTYLKKLKILDEVKLQVIIATRNKMIKPHLEAMHDHLMFKPVEIDNLILESIISDDAVYLMLEELLNFHGRILPQTSKEEITGDIYYNTGGHPRCIESVLFALAKVNFLVTKKRWPDFFNRHVLPTIEAEMLQPEIPSQLRSVFDVLSVFRRFDDPLLVSLLKNKVMNYPLAGVSVIEAASRLRRELEAISLIDEPAGEEAMFTMNFTIRRALELNMVYNDRARYQNINRHALALFTKRLEHPEKLSSEDRTAALFIQVFIGAVYHLLKDLEFKQDNKQDICLIVETRLIELLPLLLNAIGETQLRRLPSFWEEDKELEETAKRVTSNPACYNKLSRRIDDFVRESKKIMLTSSSGAGENNHEH